MRYIYIISHVFLEKISTINRARKPSEIVLWVMTEKFIGYGYNDKAIYKISGWWNTRVRARSSRLDVEFKINMEFKANWPFSSKNTYYQTNLIST